MLTDLLEQLEKGQLKRTLQGGTLDLGARTLPQLPRHSGDRNRTSPFAFTGNKFEFRAVGSSQTIAWPNTVLNTIVAESLDHVATELEKVLGKNGSPEKLEKAVLSVMQKLIRQHKRVIFDGDNYSEEWHAEAAKRGLPILKDSIESLPVLKERKNVDLFKKYGVLSKVEVESRFHIAIERYVKQIEIEAETMADIARTRILPAALRHQALLAEAVSKTQAAGVNSPEQKAALERFVGYANRLREAIGKLEHAMVHSAGELMAHAKHMRSKVLPAMVETRAAADHLESVIAAEFWPLPTYRELLFLK
jgi:glutamine synthetase